VSELGGPAAGAERARGDVEIVELSQAQASFARRVAESKATAPHVYFERQLDGTIELSAMIAAAARTLRQTPRLNGAYRDGHAETYSRVNVAFGVEAAGTLLFPVIHDADTKDEDAIAAEIEELSDQARGETLASPAFAGATFTIISMPAPRFTPVIARGQAATLGAGTEWLTLACDNRIVQGSEGAQFLDRLNDLVG
jgi:pyruvate dehydrogenase E2 component (dihydrolipoyllysine-residue acetyltransferase)